MDCRRLSVDSGRNGMQMLRIPLLNEASGVRQKPLSRRMQGSPRAERLEMRCGTWCRSTVVKLSTDSNVWSSKPCSLSIRDCVEGRRGVSLAGLAGTWIYQGIAAVCPPTLSRRKITPFRRVGSLLPEITLAGLLSLLCTPHSMRAIFLVVGMWARPYRRTRSQT
ncbi:hypothetical protein C8Q72DRAFT_606089 [Fomitopsis betulina]|nr:hypothetical protein C8Q72DRAFT_606089 [Fomitopsis betulina]